MDCLETIEEKRSPARCAFVRLHCPDGIAGILETVTIACQCEGYRKADRFKVCTALNEALVNALKHGCLPGDGVRLWWFVTPTAFNAIVEDDGYGFDPARISDPLAEDGLSKPSGRGLLLMNALMTRVTFNSCGNRVELYKEITSRPSPRADG
jgi:anti-sigma regulatory factor (Ser/Thr protein kinase)